MAELAAQARRVGAAAKWHADGKRIARVLVPFANLVAQRGDADIGHGHHGLHAQLHVVVAACAVPVPGMTTAEVQRAALAQLLREVHLVALAGAAGIAPIVTAYACEIAQRQVATCAVAVSGQTEVGAAARNVALVVDAKAVAADRPGMQRLRARMGNVGTEGTHWCVERCAGQQRAVIFAQLGAAQQGQSVADAACVGGFGKAQFFPAIAGVAQLAHGGAETAGAGTQRLRDGGEVDVETLLATVRLGNGHFKIATEMGGIQILDDERARRHRGFVDDVAVLADAHHCVALGNATHDRRKAAQRVRQHALVAGHAQAGEGHALEKLAAGVAFAQQQLAVPAGQFALQRTADHIAAATVAAMADGRAMPQSPRAQVQAGVDAEVGAVAATAAGVV